MSSPRRRNRSDGASVTEFPLIGHHECVKYLGRIEHQHLLDNPHVVIEGDRVLHLRFKVRR